MAEQEKPQIRPQTSSPARNRPWTISEMAGEFGVSHRTLRFYQQKGLLSPKRRGNTRLYFPRDFAHMKIIVAARKIDMSLDDIGQILSSYHQKNGAQIQNELIVRLLETHIENLASQQSALAEQLDHARKILADQNRDIDS
jgi:DNA-binding transcriptional MerR regulator